MNIINNLNDKKHLENYIFSNVNFNKKNKKSQSFSSSININRSNNISCFLFI